MSKLLVLLVILIPAVLLACGGSTTSIAKDQNGEFLTRRTRRLYGPHGLSGACAYRSHGVRTGLNGRL